MVELARHATLRMLLELNPVQVQVLFSVLCLPDVKWCFDIVVHWGIEVMLLLSIPEEVAGNPLQNADGA